MVSIRQLNNKEKVATQKPDQLVDTILKMI